MFYHYEIIFKWKLTKEIIGNNNSNNDRLLCARKILFYMHYLI